MLYDHVGDRVLIVAHRGARSLAPENTLAAARSALQCGAHMWELDVALTRDGVPVVFHDYSLERTTDVVARPEFAGRRPWRVCDFTLAEIRALDAGSWYGRQDPFGQVTAGTVTGADLSGFEGIRVPTLREALDLVRESGWLVNVELKDHRGLRGHGEVTGSVLGLIRELDLAEQVLLSSFQHNYLLEARGLLPDLALGVLVGESAPADPVALVRELGAHAYHPDRALVTPAKIARLRTAGIRVNVWTVNDETEARTLAAAGATGIITDFPQRLAD